MLVAEADFGLQKLITFIFPIYGIEPDILLQGLQKAANIKIESSEFLLISDGADQDSVELCRSFSKDHPRFKLIEQTNQGVSAARNTGINAAIGKWIAFVDPDDLIDEEINSIYDDLLTANVDIIFGGFKRFYENGKIDESFSTEKMFQAQQHDADTLIGATLSDSSYYQGVYGYYLGTPWAKFFRREFLIKYNLKYPVGVVKREDSLFAIQCFEHNPRILITKKNFYFYRIDHQNSISNNYNSKVNASFIRVFEILSADLSSWLKSPKNQEIYATYALRLTIELLFSDFCNVANPKKYAERHADFTNYVNNPVVRDLIKNSALENMPFKQKVLGQLIKWHWFAMLNLILKRKGH